MKDRCSRGAAACWPCCPGADTGISHNAPAMPLPVDCVVAVTVASAAASACVPAACGTADAASSTGCSLIAGPAAASGTSATARKEPQEPPQACVGIGIKRRSQTGAAFEGFGAGAGRHTGWCTCRHGRETQHQPHQNTRVAIPAEAARQCGAAAADGPPAALLAVQQPDAAARLVTVQAADGDVAARVGRWDTLVGWRDHRLAGVVVQRISLQAARQAGTEVIAAAPLQRTRCPCRCRCP